MSNPKKKKPYYFGELEVIKANLSIESNQLIPRFDLALLTKTQPLTED